MEEHLQSVGNRIVIVGTSGSGKTTLAKHLAEQLNYHHVELDALHWEPNWQEAKPDVLRERVSQAISGESWIVDGNYSHLRDLIWPRADTVIWLNYSLATTLKRVTFRTFRRFFEQEELWNGNQEKLRMLLSRDSIVLWALQTHPKNRDAYPKAFAQPEHAHLTVIEHPSPRTTDEFLRCLQDSRSL